jgi:hypothetical protein
MSTIDTHKRGDSFARVLTLPDTFASGYFVGWAVACQLRNASEHLVSDITATWADPLTTRALLLSVTDTAAWPVQLLSYDVQMTRPDGWIVSTNTLQLRVTRDETRP